VYLSKWDEGNNKKQPTDTSCLPSRRQRFYSPLAEWAHDKNAASRSYFFTERYKTDKYSQHRKNACISSQIMKRRTPFTRLQFF